MNRLLKTAAVAALMAASGAANAASYVLDPTIDGTYFDSSVVATDSATVSLGNITRTADFAASFTDPNDTSGVAQVYFGDTDNVFLDIADGVGVSTSLTVHYDISSLFGLLTPGPKAVSFTVIGTDGGGAGLTSIDVKQNGTLLGSWHATVAIPGGVPGYSETPTFQMNALTGSDDLAFYVNGPDGYDLTATNFVIQDVVPVPEPGEWAMMIAGLGVVGFAVSRRRAVQA